MNNQKMQYQIVKTANLDAMEDITLELAEKGWQPAGPVTEVKNVGEDGIRFYHKAYHFVIKTMKSNSALKCN